MKRSRAFLMLTALAVLSTARFAAARAARGPPEQQTAPGTAAGAATQELPKICLDVQTSDDLTREFADRLRDAIAASGVFGLAASADSCNLQLHVPGNLLRFETAGGIMVSTVVIVTSPAGRYLSTSITACRASDLKPCAMRAIAAAKLAFMVSA